MSGERTSSEPPPPLIRQETVANQGLRVLRFVRYLLLIFIVLGTVELFRHPDLNTSVSLLIGFGIMVAVVFCERHLRNEERIKEQGIEIADFIYQIKKGFGDFTITGSYVFQGNTFDLFKKIKHLRGNRNNDYWLLKEKGAQVKITLKIDPLKPQKNVLIFHPL